MNALYKTLVLAPFALFCACTNSGTAGSTTETENAIARGDGTVTIRLNDAARAAYRVLPNSFVADTAGTPVPDSAYTYMGETDSAGGILIKDHLEGSFTIEIEKGDSAIAFQYTLSKENKEFAVKSAKLTARGAVMGAVSVPENAPHAWVHVPGVGRVVKTDTLGNFFIEGLPTGKLSIVSWNVQTQDTIAETSVEVPAKDTLDLGHILAPGETINKQSMSVKASGIISSWMKPVSIPSVMTLRLDSANFDFASAKGDGSDVHLLDKDGNEVPMQVDFWDSTRQSAAIFVRLESQKDTSATWTLEWGDPYAKPQEQVDVWKSVSDSLKYALNSVEFFNFDSKAIVNDLPSPLKKYDWYVQLHTVDTLSDSVTVKTLTPASFLQADTKGRPGTVAHIEYTADYPDYIVFGTRVAQHTHDWGRMDSLVVWLRGDGDYEIILENLIDSLNYKASHKGKLSSSWERITLKPEDFDYVQRDYHGWEAARDKITNFTIFAYNGSEIWIDNVRAYGINVDEFK